MAVAVDQIEPTLAGTLGAIPLSIGWALLAVTVDQIEPTFAGALGAVPLSIGWALLAFSSDQMVVLIAEAGSSIPGFVFEADCNALIHLNLVSIVAFAGLIRN